MEAREYKQEEEFSRTLTLASHHVFFQFLLRSLQRLTPSVQRIPLYPGTRENNWNRPIQTLPVSQSSLNLGCWTLNFRGGGRGEGEGGKGLIWFGPRGPRLFSKHTERTTVIEFFRHFLVEIEDFHLYNNFYTTDKVTIKAKAPHKQEFWAPATSYTVFLNM